MYLSSENDKLGHCEILHYVIAFYWLVFSQLTKDIHKVGNNF